MMNYQNKTQVKQFSCYDVIMNRPAVIQFL